MPPALKNTFGWIKTIGGLRKIRHLGRENLSGQALLNFAGYNPVRVLSLIQLTFSVFH